MSRSGISNSICHPTTINQLVGQVAHFTGWRIALYPHDRAPVYRGDFNLSSQRTYKQFLNLVSQKKDVGVVAFVMKSSDGGADIVYADHAPRWSGQLNSDNSIDKTKLANVSHELGHLLITATGSSLPRLDLGFYNEQVAILGGAVLTASVGQELRIPYHFPALQEFNPTPDNAAHEYPTFSIYTPSPLTQFFASKQGIRYAQENFLTSDGIVRVDKISDLVVMSSLHAAWHLNAMKLFGSLAQRLAKDPSYANYVASNSPWINQTGYSRTSCGPEDFARTFMQEWWAGLRDRVKNQSLEVPQNIYAGFYEPIASIHHAQSYFVNLGAACRYAIRFAPHDPLLQSVNHAFEMLFTNIGVLPSLEQHLRVRLESKRRSFFAAFRTSNHPNSLNPN